MTTIHHLFHPRSQSRPLQFAGNVTKDKMSASIPDDESDTSSIHTNPETQKVISEVHQTLEDLKGQIPEEQWQILNKGANFFQVEMNRLKHSGRKWERDADRLGEDFLATSDQLESKQAELTKEKQEKRDIQHRLNELKETEKQIADVDAELERLNREAAEIREILNTKQPKP